MGLGICSGCRRFARGESCPFCGAIVAAPTPAPAGRRSRGRLVGSAIAAVAGAAVAVACGDSVTTDAGPTFDAAYGGPPFDSGGYDSIALYGGPPIDSGTDATPDARDASDDSPSDAREGG